MGGFLKTGLHGCDMSLAMHSIFDELCDKSCETFLVHNTANDGEDEHGRRGEAAQPRL